VKRFGHKGAPTPLDSEGLERLALFYVGRYATTRGKLRQYLDRKVKERGWNGAERPETAILADRMAELGFIDDAAFALSRAATLQRRGLGARRLTPVLRAAGIEEQDAAEARASAQDQAWPAALRFAERKRIGPYAAEKADRELRAKQFAMMMRAGHSVEIARRLLDFDPGEIANEYDL
jgi:regulatory protein